MSKEIILFSKEELTFKDKFYNLMNLLINNQSSSMMETLLLISIFYLQIISSCFDKQIKVFNGDSSFVDMILNDLKILFRIRDLMRDSYFNYLLLLIALFCLIIIFSIHFLIICFSMTRKSIYNTNQKLINIYIKFFLYIFYNVILDLCFSSFCMGSDEQNPHFSDQTCSINDHILSFIISIILIIVSFSLYNFIQIYYSDPFYLNNSFFSKMSCNYDLYMGLNSLIQSLLLNQSKFLSKEFFLIYNTIISILLFIFYYNHLLFYDKYTNLLVGIYHSLYAWTSIFSLIFNFLDFGEKGIIYIISSILVIYLYLNLQKKLNDIIFFDIPFYEIKNPFYLLYYFHVLIDKISRIDEDPTSKSFLTGIMEMHKVECPNPLCVSKTKENLYLPMNKKWSDRAKNFIEDEVFLKSLLIVIMNYFISTNKSNADMYLNLSLYYLTIIGNYCQSIYFYRKIIDLKLTAKEEFSLIRLSIKISNTLLEALKSPNEQCVSLENLNVSMYYKYDDLSQNFVDEISNDVNLSLEFWKTFRASLRDHTKKVDFNKIFQLTDKIRITKKNVEVMWNELLSIYGGVNAYFKLYSEYVEQINDDDLKKRDLESLKRKNDNFSDHIGQNYYSVLFNKETVILIANGDKGNEGVIELSNKEIENIFKYRPMDIKGMNLTALMPKLFSKNHSKYIERYFKIGEKKILDKNDYKIYGKDKNNSIIKIKMAVKLFPILNENIFFVGLVVKENIDDIIIMDENFYIQGMSSKLMRILNIENKFIFQENEIPFYAICRKFINFYSIFLNTKKTPEADLDETIEEGNFENTKKNKDNKGVSKEDGAGENIQINENVELEYEIKLPQFLIDYSDKTNRKDNKLGVKSSSMNSEIQDNDNNEDEDIEEQYEENDLLIDKGSEIRNETTDSLKESNIRSKLSKNMKSRLQGSRNPSNKNINDTLTPTPTPTPDGDTPTPTPNGNRHHRPSSNMKENLKNNLKENYSKQSEEEKVYRQKMRQYKSLFNNNKFSELEDLIDLNNKDSTSIEFKFNFTFDRIKYGNNQVAYIVRCIDNKNELGRSEEESIEDFDPKAAKYKKDKSEAIKPLYELYEGEKKEIIEMQDKFLKLSIENKKFQKLLQACKNEIVNTSKAHGHNKDEILEDENSSQSSQAGFDSGLVKKNRIEEIRSNLLINISNFYTLKYLRLASVLLGGGTIAFIVVYISSFTNINNSLKNVSEININLFQSTLWTTELVSIFISLRTLFKNSIYPRDDFYFNNYVFENVEDNQTYYTEMKLQAHYLYNNLSNAYGFLEMNIPNYLSVKNLKEMYWDNINVSYHINLTNINSESFPMSMAQVLSSSYSYLFDSIYNLNLTEDQKDEYISNPENEEYFSYTTHLIIENAYDYVLPNQFEKLLTIPKKLSEYNADKKKPILIMIFIYTAFMILICASFFLLIHLTNKSMTDGLEKVTKIRLEKIEETIKKIEAFNASLKKFRDKDSKASPEKEESEASDDQKMKNQQGDAKSNVSIDKRKKNNDSASIIGSNGFNTDVKKYIPLNVLNSSFFHGFILFIILCGFLIPTYIYSNEMITNTNQLLLVENYIFGKLITASTKTVEIKCFMSECQTEKQSLNYTSLVNMSLIQEVIKGINLFSDVNKFYNNKYLLDACATCMDISENYSYYEQCLNEPLIISANNTDNLIKLIEDLVENILKEHEMEIEENNTSYYKEQLYNTSYFKQMEEIFYLYIIQVGDIFADTVNKDLNSFLKMEKTLITILVICLGVIMFIYCLYLGIFFVRTLIHYLSVSRCIMKIIPTSVIISTQELETWIENKY